MWHYADGMGWWMLFGGVWMLFGGVWMLVFWGGLIALVVWGITKLSGRSSSSTGKDPLDAAKERYALGEISREEFEQLRKDLS